MVLSFTLLTSCNAMQCYCCPHYNTIHYLLVMQCNITAVVTPLQHPTLSLGHAAADLIPSPCIIIVSVDVNPPGNVGTLLLQSNQQVHGLTIKS